MKLKEKLFHKIHHNSLLRNIYNSSIFQKIYFRGKVSYAQSGEDLILNQIFKGVKKGFYIDIGANNPFVNSNTYFFYKKGWKGINIDALPKSMNSFNLFRKRDINLEIAISNNESVLKYYMYSSSFYNTFCKETAEMLKNKNYTKLVETREIKSQKLSDVLDKLRIDTIDFMTIDVEGLDLNVLKSNNWKKYNPNVIITELWSTDLDNLKNNGVYIFLINNGYRYFCNTPTNIFYVKNSFISIR